MSDQHDKDKKLPLPSSTTAPSAPLIKNSLDAILSHYAKKLKPGESITFPLIKGGCTPISIDPRERAKMEQSKAMSTAINSTSSSSTSSLSPGMDRGGGGSDGYGSREITSKASDPALLLSTSFPRIAKFPATVARPIFGTDGSQNSSTSGSYNKSGSEKTDPCTMLAEGRMYEDEVPKVLDESDEEAESPTINQRKKRRRGTGGGPRKCWIIQERAEFVERLRLMQLKKKNPAAARALEEKRKRRLSSRYEGTPEASSGLYVTLQVQPGWQQQEKRVEGDRVVSDIANTTGRQRKEAASLTSLPQIAICPIFGVNTFAQPARFRCISSNQAEEMVNLGSGMHGDGDDGGGGGIRNRPVITRYMMHARTDPSGGGDGNGAEAGPKAVSEPGSGVNDSMIGSGGGPSASGRVGLLRRLGKGVDGTQLSAAVGGGSTMDGMAMQDDFYQRDVEAEYKEMDYNPNEQFDDDDVDVGAGEVQDTGGFAPDIDDDEEDDVNDDDDDGFGSGKGFASHEGMKEMLAKARGKTSDNQIDSVTTNAAGVAAASSPLTSGGTSSAFESGSDGTDVDEGERSPSKKKALPAVSPGMTNSGIQLDESGLRVINLGGVRRELWLHRGTLSIKQLHKIYSIKGKKNPTRKATLNRILQELCTLNGNMLTLKQHYSNMG